MGLQWELSPGLHSGSVPFGFPPGLCTAASGLHTWEVNLTRSHENRAVCWSIWCKWGKVCSKTHGWGAKTPQCFPSSRSWTLTVRNNCTDVVSRLFHTRMVPKAEKGGLYRATPPYALPAEVAAFLSVIVKCRSSRLMGPYRVPSGFSTAGSAMSSEGMTEFFHASVNSSWAFLHTEAWENLQFKTLVLNQIEVGLGLGWREATFLSAMWCRSCSLSRNFFSPKSFCLSVRQISCKRNPTENMVPREVERTIGESLAMSWYEVCSQKMLGPGFSVSLSSRFIRFSLGTTSPHTAFDLVKDGGVTAILLLLLLLSFLWTGPVEFFLTILLWKLYSYILQAGIILHKIQFVQ